VAGTYRILPVSVLTTLSGPARPLRSPLVVVLRGPADTTTANLLEPSVRRTVTVHPALAGWLTAAGWKTIDPPVTRHGNRAERQQWRLRPRPRSIDAVELDPLRGTLSGEELAALCAGGTPRRRRAHIAGLDVTVEVRPGALTVETTTAERTPAAVHAHLGDVDALIAGDPAWFALEKLRHQTLVVTADPGNPAQALVTPPGAQRPAGESALGAMSQVEEQHLSAPVALDRNVLDVAAIAATGPGDRPGLHPTQDELVSALLATDTGIVLAARPGSGKTVIAATAIAESPAAHIIVAAPPAVVDQWREELARWAPRRTVRTAGDVAALRRHRTRPGVTVTTHQVLARWARTARSGIELLVLDEASAVLRRTETGRGLWQARALAGQGWALTGTPDEHGGGGGTGNLVAWARNLARDAVADRPPEAYTPIVAGLAIEVHIPDAVVEPLGVHPGPDDTTWIAALTAAMSQHTNGLTRANHARRLRLGLGDPRAAGGNIGGTKHAAALDRVLEHAAAGGSSLLFTASETLAHATADAILRNGINAVVLPAPGRRGERIRTLAAYAAGNIPALVLTPASQRGVNLQKADLVVHLDLPATRAEFTQRNGRAVRYGSPHRSVRILVPYLTGTLDETWTRRFLDPTGTEPDPLELLDR